MLSLNLSPLFTKDMVTVVADVCWVETDEVFDDG